MTEIWRCQWPTDHSDHDTEAEADAAAAAVVKRGGATTFAVVFAVDVQ